MAFKIIKQEILRALNENNIHIPTGIQNKTIPEIIAGRDIIGISKTGSGKTIAFVIPFLQTLKHDKNVQKLVICPTRELAVQIANEVKKFGKYVNANPVAIYGGASINVQIQELRRANIVIGTPGRLLDHLSRNTLNLSNVNCLVLDEADKMADMGFIDDIKEILNKIPGARQTLLFGATISEEINWLKKKYMKEPEIIKDEVHVKEEFLEQFYYDLEYNQKFSFLMHLLQQNLHKKVIIFCSARHTVEKVCKNIWKQNFKAEMLHGKLTQSKRLKIIEDFNKGHFHTLVASSVAARGLDIKNISLVINYDLSRDPQEYIHKIGRTARAGEHGKAITILSDRDHDTFRQILARYHLKITKMPKEEFEQIKFFVPEHQDRRNQGSFRRNQGSHRRSNDRRYNRYNS